MQQPLPLTEREVEVTNQPAGTVASGASRTHLYEIDLARAVTAICVVGVHATFFTLFINSSPLGGQLQNGVVDALHFTRELFLSITAFLMVYVYAHHPFPVWTFWRKRGLGVLVPYIFWSLVYVWLGAPHSPLRPWLLTALVDIVTGTASYQLYFILLSIEFYILLPWFLPIIQNVGGRHPWRLLVGSGTLQLVLLYLDHNLIQVGTFAATDLGQAVNGFQAGFLPLYQFYAVLGGLAALHAARLRPFVLNHGRWIIACGVLGLAALWIRYGVAVWIQHRSDDYSTTVFQPMLVFYSAAVALFLYWIGVAWAVSRAPAPPPGFRLWSLLGDVSFGVYLIHPLILGPVLAHVLPLLPVYLPVPARVAAVWGSAAGLTIAVCIVLLYVPLASRLIGRPRSHFGSLLSFRHPALPPLLGGRRLASRQVER
jgi:probable poly-beta-1,6-N-acetyl-D-glucosamine export protein